MKREQGFSLIELLVVVTIIGIIAAIAVPGLRRARQNAQSTSAVQTLRMVTTAQIIYERKHKVYATLAQLLPEATLDIHVASGEKGGYQFVVTLPPDAKRFEVNATPVEEAANRPHYFVDDTGVIRFNDGAPATAASQPIPR